MILLWKVIQDAPERLQVRILVCINYGRTLVGAAITRLPTWAPAMIAWACACTGLGVATLLLLLFFVTEDEMK